MTFDLLHAGLIVPALAAVALAIWFRQAAAPELARLKAELESERAERAADQAERDAARARAEVAERRAEAQAATLAERELGAAREREQFEKLQRDSEARFRQLAGEALLKTQEQFIQIADETLKKHKEGAQGELGLMLKPIQESFGQFREKVAEIEKVRAEDRARLDEQLKAVGDTARLTREITGKLQQALTSTRGGGRWGEETLRNVLEIAGLSPYADFTEQASASTESGRIRPDVVVRLPGGRHLVIDSKVSLDDYLAAAEETDGARARQRLAAHAARVRAHAAALGRKDYWRDIPDTVDFVAMFIPGENFYAAVLEHDREIFDFAARNNVIIVTPSTLIALAKSVAYGWRQEQMARNAEQAGRLGRDLYERLAKMIEHMSRVGSGIGNATKAYNDMVGSFESRVLPAARRFEELQIVDATKPVEAPIQVDTRQLALLDVAPAGAPAPAAAPKRK
jgi:DNA recombination protein RmuC